MPSKLSKTCIQLLSAAHALESGILLLPRGRFEDLSAATNKAIAQLLRRGLVSTHRDQLMITEAGRALVDPKASQATIPAADNPLARSKTTLLLNLLREDGGATVVKIVDATGWLPHSIRAAISGLRKRGHVIELVNIDGVSRYRAMSK